MDAYGSPSERFGTWIAKRATIVLVLFVVWSWFVASPDSFAGALDKTGAAWCAIAPCPSEAETGQPPELGDLLPAPDGVWSGLEGLHDNSNSVLDGWGLKPNPDDERAGAGT